MVRFLWKEHLGELDSSIVTENAPMKNAEAKERLTNRKLQKNEGENSLHFLREEVEHYKKERVSAEKKRTTF